MTRFAGRRRRLVAALLVSLLAGTSAVEAQSPAPSPSPSPVPSPSRTAAPTTAAQGFGADPYGRLRPPVDAGALRVVRAAPKGQLRSSGQASELRWVFDRPVVELSAIDQRADVAANVTITPTVAGSFRWASTRTLVFTPAKRLPRSTRYTVVLRALTALDGSKMSAPLTTTFDTPRVRCEFEGADERITRVAVRCDQPVDGQDVAAHVRLRPRQQAVDPAPFRLSADDRARLEQKDRTSLDRLDAALTRLARAGQDLGETPVAFQQTSACPNDRSRSCLWLAPRQPLPRDADVEVAFLDGIAANEGPLTSQNVASGAFSTPETPLVGTPCRTACRPPLDGFSLRTRSSFEPAALAGKLVVREVGGQRAWTYQLPAADDDQRHDPLSLRWAPIEPRRSYDVEVDPTAVSQDGTPLGIRFLTRVAFGGRAASLVVREGEVVREAGLGLNLPIPVRNVTSLDVVAAAIEPERVAAVRREVLDATSDVDRVRRLSQLPVRAVAVPRRTDADQTYAVPVPAPGTYLLAVRATAFESLSDYDPATTGKELRRWHVAVVQVTDTAFTVKRSPTSGLLSVTSLTTGKPLAGVPVQLWDGSGSPTGPLWSGTSGADGFAWAQVLAPTGESGELVAVATGQGGTAYASTAWGTGQPIPYFDVTPTGPRVAVAPGKASGTDQTTPTPPAPVLAPGERFVGTAFADRGVYRPGEEVHVRGQLRVQAPRALRLPPPVGSLTVTVTDDRGTIAREQAVPVDTRGGWELAFTLPADARHGTWYVASRLAGATSFLVTEFRRPDFQVDVALDRPSPAAYVTGDTLRGTIAGQYLFGEVMRGRDAAWTLTEDGTSYDPSAKHPELGLEGYSWAPACTWYSECVDGRGELAKGSGVLDPNGQLAVSRSIGVRTDRHGPVTLTLEGTVTNVDRQVIANRASALVHPGELYVGVKAGSYFGQKGKPLALSAVALTPAGAWKPGVTITARLFRLDWSRTQDQRPRSIEVGSAPVTSSSAPVPVALTPDQAGQYEVRVEAVDGRGNHVEAGTFVYVLGAGDGVFGNPITTVEVTPQRASYRLGETAELLVRSPWPNVEAMVTVERDDVITARRLTITGSAAAVQVPLTDETVPDVVVAVTVFKPRTQGSSSEADPAVAVGSAHLSVPPERQKLAVALTTDSAAYRPGAPAKATVQVTDANGRAAPGRLTLWAVDEGVLRLTGYEQPDLLAAFFADRGSRVSTADSRARLTTPAEEQAAKRSADLAAGGIAPSVATESAAPASTGNGSEQEPAPDADLRTDLRILATWQGSVAVGANGSATSTFALPQSLTSYRLLAVADSGDDRFGGATTVVQTRKPLMVQPALPRFASLGDTFEAGAVVQNQTGAPGSATVTLELPAGSPVTVDGAASRTLPLPAGPTEVRFRVKASGLGTVQGVLRARMGAETDAVQIAFPVLITRRTETVAASGVVEAGGPPDVEQLRLPGAAYPDLGGLDLAVSSSALAGLQNGVAELVEYPYGCLEQRSSRLRVLLMLQDLKQAFPIPALGGQDLRTAVVAELARMREYQTSGGGLSYWPGDESPDVFLSARVLVLLLDARDLGYQLPAGLVEPLTEYLQNVLAEADANRITRPSSDATGLWYNRAHVLYALARGGQPQLEGAIALWNRREYLSVLEQVHLVHALVLSGDTSSRPSALLGELLNGLRVEADQAFLQDDVAYDEDELCPCLRYLFPDRGAAPHDTAELLSLLVRVDPKDAAAGQMARWLLAQRDAKGVWRNTLENGYALTALVRYYRAAESVAADFRGKVLVGAVTAFEGVFSGRSLALQAAQVPMGRLRQAVGDPTKAVPLTVSATGGGGRLYWAARLTYAPSSPSLPALDSGFRVTREYFPAAANGQAAAGAGTTFAAGALVRVRLTVTSAQARRNVVIDDPLPAGLEALNPELASTARSETAGTGVDQLWPPGVDHVELHDERVLLFATALRSGTLTYTYVARATAPGTFSVAPTQAAEMYRPELFGRTASTTVTVTPPPGT